MNELKDICDKLEGFSKDPAWVIEEARQLEDGKWQLLIKRPAVQEENNAGE